MGIHIFIGFIVLLYYLIACTGRMIWWGPRKCWYAFSLCRQALIDIANQQGGNLYQAGWRRLIYTSHNEKVQTEINCDSRATLAIRIRESFPFSVTFYRLPRLLYTFLEAFISPDLRIEQHPYFVLTSAPEPVSNLKKRPGFIPLFRQLSQLGYSLQFDRRGLNIWKSMRLDELNELPLMNAMRLARDISEVCNVEAGIPVQAVFSEKRCAYCKETIGKESAVSYCSVCSTPHHVDCFQLNGKCSVFGCESVKPVDTPLRVAM